MAKRKALAEAPPGSDPLAAYNAKRDFGLTPEPAGEIAPSADGNRFIVQKHAATRLHWDLRLEVDGVLKSWAVTRGPSIDPDDKRLAVRTEDHPMSYADFEGNIPKKEYGGGTVMLWDRGTWAPIAGKSAKDLDEGHLHFTLDGERMRGEWLLIRLKPRPGEKRENWLLRKIRDAEAGEGDVLVETALTSVLTGRTMAEIAADTAGTQALAGKDDRAFAQAMKAAATRNASVAKRRRSKGSEQPPAFRPPQLATLVDDVPAGNGWMHEIKFDGYRALIATGGGKVTVWTRNGLDWTDKFAPLVGRFAALDFPPALIDGEIVALDANGNPDFSTLQNALKRGHGAEDPNHPLAFFAFDLLEVDGEGLTALPNIVRKERLEALMGHAPPPLHVADHLLGSGEKLFAAMEAAGQEGIISKRIDAPYLSKRTKNWLKIKCTRREAFRIIGMSRSTTKARPFASLLLAREEGSELVYAGKVGTGFDNNTIDALSQRLERLIVEDAPVEVPRVEARGARWVRPELIAEVAFAEMTGEGRVRHGSFIGLVEGKGKRAKAAAPAAEAVVEKVAKKARAKPATDPLADSGVRLTNPDRVVFPETGETKGELAAYYAQVAGIMLPHAGARPVSLVRCPQGRGKKCFFQKHDAGSFGAAVKQVPIREKDGSSEDYLFVDTPAGLVSCVQMGTIEFHGWGARIDDVEKPDRLIFDLDPDEGLDFGDTKGAAEHLRRHLADLGLVSFAMLSGGKGVHVVVPLTPEHSWEVHKDFARRFAEALSLAEPDRFVATMSKAKRVGRIFIDWLRNQRGATAVLPYSVRAREGAPVAAPVTWEELAKIDTAARWTLHDAAELNERAVAKALRGWGFAAQKLPGV